MWEKRKCPIEAEPEKGLGPIFKNGEVVKSRKGLMTVIPAEAGIQ